MQYFLLLLFLVCVVAMSSLLRGSGNCEARKHPLWNKIPRANRCVSSMHHTIYEILWIYAYYSVTALHDTGIAPIHWNRDTYFIQLKLQKVLYIGDIPAKKESFWYCFNLCRIYYMYVQFLPQLLCRHCTISHTWKFFATVLYHHSMIHCITQVYRGK
jgi:hypothetical protein